MVILVTYEEVVAGVHLLHVPLLLHVLVDLVLVFFELDICLDDVDVGGLEQAAHFAHVRRSDHRVGVQAGHRLGQSDQRLELTDRVPVAGRRAASVLVRLSQLLVLVPQDQR